MERDASEHERSGTERPRLPDLADMLASVPSARLDLEPGQRLFICGDIHLGDGTHADAFGAKDDHLLAFLDHVAAHGHALVILGDALDFHQAWSIDRINKAHRRVLGRLNELTEELPVHYIYGNHDPDMALHDNLVQWDVCNQVIVNERVLIQHGYEYDTFVGEKFDQSSQWTKLLSLYERTFRTWIRVPLKEYYTFSNRLVHWLVHWLFHLSDVLGRLEARLGRSEATRQRTRQIEFWTKSELGDPMAITRPALARALHDRFETIVCGHSHLPGVVRVPGTERRYANTGSWTFDNCQFGLWTPEQGISIWDWLTLERFGDERYLPIFRGETDRTFSEWYSDEYLGWLRFKSGEDGKRRGVRPPDHHPPPLPAPGRSTPWLSPEEVRSE